MRERNARAEPFLSGMFTRGEVVYAGSEAEAAHDREPVAIFTGEVLPLYAADIDDDRIRILLNELAAEIFPGRCLAMFLPAGTCGAGPSGSMFRLSSRWALAEYALPKSAEPDAGSTIVRAATVSGRLALLGASVLAVALGGVTGSPLTSGIGLAIGTVLLVILLRIEQRPRAASFRLLPTDAYRPQSVLGAVSLAMALMVATTTAVLSTYPMWQRKSAGIRPSWADI